MKKIVLATGNAGKVSEIQAIFSSLTTVTLAPQSEWSLSPVAETGLTFIENALIKARFAAEQTGLPAIADDSGLTVSALNGAPGIYSARFAGEGASAADRNKKLLNLLSDSAIEDRQAAFRCVAVFLRSPDDPVPVIAEGIWEGTILHASVGTGGFGYDPVFYVPTHDCSVAELSPDVKNQLSHRGQAMHALREKLERIF